MLIACFRGNKKAPLGDNEHEYSVNFDQSCSMTVINSITGILAKDLTVTTGQCLAVHHDH